MRHKVMTAAILAACSSFAAVLIIPDSIAFECLVVRETWDHEKLFSRAECVAIVQPKKSIDGDDRISLKETGVDAELRLVKTTVGVVQILKGKNAKQLVIHHYKLVTSDIIIENPPKLVLFRMKAQTIIRKSTKLVLPPPDYLVYLKMSDGKYYFVSEPSYTQDSAFELNQPVFGD